MCPGTYELSATLLTVMYIRWSSGVNLLCRDVTVCGSVGLFLLRTFILLNKMKVVQS